MASAFKTELDAQGSNLSMYPFDLSVLDSTRVSPRYKAQLCNEIFSVAMMQGYFAIVGHGITESERDEFLTAQKAFFELPEENKKELAPVELEYRGYLEKEEAVCPAAFHIRADDLEPGNQWPPSQDVAPNFERLSLAMFAKMEAIARRLHNLLIQELVDAGTLTERESGLVRRMHGQQNNEFAVLFYDRSNSIAPSFHTHVDDSSLSIVMQHQPGGLEFAHKTDQGSVFEPAPIFPGMLTVLVGHFFDWISDRALEGVRHREVSNEPRYSATFFLKLDVKYINYDTHPKVLDPLNWGGL